MHRIYLIAFFLAIFNVANPSFSQCDCNAPLVAVPNLGDIARTVWNPSLQQAVILYDPQVVLNAGPVLTSFFRAHECHHYLNMGNLLQSQIMPNPYDRVTFARGEEIAADTFATDCFISNPDTLRTVVQFFNSPYGNWGDLTHLPTNIRGKIVEDEYKKQTGDDLFPQPSTHSPVPDDSNNSDSTNTPDNTTNDSTTASSANNIDVPFSFNVEDAGIFYGYDNHPDRYDSVTADIFIDGNESKTVDCCNDDTVPMSLGLHTLGVKVILTKTTDDGFEHKRSGWAPTQSFVINNDSKLEIYADYGSGTFSVGTVTLQLKK